jgi:DNA-binding NtrC family response regulator
MAKKTTKIFILEDDAYFRGMLEELCSELGETLVAPDVASGLGLLSRHSFDLLLLDWHLNPQDQASLQTTIENFQSASQRIALFTVPDLPNVIAAMKTGVSDILWVGQERSILLEKIRGCLSLSKPIVFAHSFVSRLTDSLTEKAMVQKTSLFQARREFSRTFLQQILSQQKLRRTQLADLMSVSPRTLHRHLST